MVDAHDAPDPESGPATERVPAAGAVVTDDLGRVLLVLRGTEPERGRWSVPGGSAEPGETFARAAARETLEETGLVVEIGRELWTVEIPAGDGRVYEVRDFAATVTAGVPRAGDDAEDVRWFSPDELDEVPLTRGLRDHLARAGVVPA
ncbi:NUDIX hydrolase [Nocardiopsis alba]|uniref:NUDIX hydrolase n=1 Tax=Nocardiopsis alba TaxID=53437 RepID=UPI003D75CE41